MAVALGLFLLTACGAPPAGAPAQQGGKLGGTLAFGLSSYPPSLKAFVGTGTAAQTVKLAIHRGLVGYDARGELAGELAEKWERQGDSTYVFQLRKNAKFHNGDPVTAEDVKFSLETILDPKTAATLLSQLQIIQKIDTPDPQTVQITLKQPSASFIAALAQSEAPVISKKAAQAKADDEVGAGPFVIKQAEKGVKIEVAKFPDYYKPGLPKLDGIKFVVYADENPRVAALQTGDMDLIEYVPWKDMATIEKDPKLSLLSTNGPFMYLLFNITGGAFSKAEVRRAIGFAINRDAVSQAAFFGRGGPINGMPIPSSSPSYSEKLANFWSYDQAKAKKMIADAGYPDGFSTTLLSTAQYGMHQDTAQVVQSELEKVGVRVKLNLPDWPTRVQLGNKEQYEFAVMGSGGRFNDPDFLTDFIGSGTPYYARSAGFSDPKIDQLLAEGRATLDPAKRKQIYDQVQAAALEAAPIVPLTWRSQAYALQKSVQGFANLPGFLTFLSGYTLENVSLNK